MQSSVEWPQPNYERGWKNIGYLHVHKEKEMGFSEYIAVLDSIFQPHFPHSCFSLSLACCHVTNNTGAANNGLWAKSNPRPVFVSQVLLKQPRPFVYLLSMDAFHAVMAELNSFGRDTVACKALTIYYLDL